MSLHLDARHRAMLQEMGVHVWWPTQTPEAAQAPAQEQCTESPPPHAPTKPVAMRFPAGTATRSAPPPVQPALCPAPSNPPTPGAMPSAYRLHAPRLFYPGVDPQQTPPGLGAGWLIVTEGQPTADPLSVQTDRLLDNMLRALGLHRHPRVYLSVLEHPAAGAASSVADTAPATLADTVAALQPSVVLVMGRVAAREVLGRSEPLGRLRTQTHCVGAVPAIVTYDASYLLRAPDAKPMAWTDLCRAQALVRTATNA